MTLPEYRDLAGNPDYDAAIYRVICEEGEAKRADVLEETGVTAQQFHDGVDRLQESNVVVDAGWGTYAPHPLAASADTIAFYADRRSAVRAEVVDATVRYGGLASPGEIAAESDQGYEWIRTVLKDLAEDGVLARDEQPGDRKLYALSGDGEQQLHRIPHDHREAIREDPTPQATYPSGYRSTDFTSEPQIHDALWLADDGPLPLRDLVERTGGNRTRTRLRLNGLVEDGLLSIEERSGDRVRYWPAPETTSAYAEAVNLPLMGRAASNGIISREALHDEVAAVAPREDLLDIVNGLLSRWKQEGFITSTGRPRDYTVEEPDLAAGAAVSD